MQNFPSSPKSASSKILPGFFRILMLSVCVASFLFTGCKKELGSGETLPGQGPDVSVLGNIPTALRPAITKVKLASPKGENARGRSVYTDLLSGDPQYKQMVLKALKLSDKTCDDNTRLNQWLGREVADWNSTVIFYANNTAMLDLPTYHALVFENKTMGQYFGKRGEYTFSLLKSFDKLKRFWNIDSRDMVLAGMHGSMLRDRSKVYPTYQVVYGLDAEDATYYTDLVAQLLQVFPQYRKGDHPIFTFNAFSQASIAVPEIGVIPPKIVMGDGILEGFAAIGYEDVAPQAILAHEYGHQIQFQLGLFTGDRTAESTRRTELMADAYSAYYLSHVRGEFMRWNRVKQFLQVFFNLGDCATTSSSHHGTPEQRMAAAEWAYEVATNAHKKGVVIESEVFTRMFDQALPGILDN